MVGEAEMRWGDRVYSAMVVLAALALLALAFGGALYLQANRAQ